MRATSRRIVPLLAATLLAGGWNAAPADPPSGLAGMRSLALELLRAGEYRRSTEAYREIVRHTPGDPRSHYDLAAALAFLGAFEEAEEPAREAARLAPDDADVQELAALVYLNLRRWEEAFEATLRGALLGDATAMYALVPLYRQGRGVEADIDEALAWAERAARAGHMGAMDFLARTHREGLHGRPVDEDKARAWARRLREAERAP